MAQSDLSRIFNFSSFCFLIKTQNLKNGYRNPKTPHQNSNFGPDFLILTFGRILKTLIRALRAKIANHVLINQHEFNHLVLDMKSPDEYAAWIQSDNSWGGSVELKIFRF